MDDAQRNIVQNWLTKGLNDLKSARILSTAPEPILDTAVYHCQQAAEKCLKGYLLFKNEELTRTHDLETLLRQAIPHDGEFESLLDAAFILNPYATEYRYPTSGAVEIPEADEFQEALQSAEQIQEFTLLRIPGEAHPQDK